MRKRSSRRWLVATALLGGGLLVQGNLSCGSFFGNAAVSSLDFCFVFDCVDGALGGLIDPCGATVGPDTGGGGDDGGTGDAGDSIGQSGGPFLADCVNVSGAGT